MTPRSDRSLDRLARFDRLARLGRRVRSAASPLLVLTVALAAIAVFSYLGAAYGTAITVGVGAVLTSLFVLLTRE